MIEKKKEKIEITLEYLEGNDKPQIGHFQSAVVHPKYLSELNIWVNEKMEFDENKDQFVKVSGYQINILGSRKAIKEFGKYLIALSKFETLDENYHDHFDELGKIDNEDSCEIIVHHPNRLKK
jgi:hypothetical protein